MPPVGRVKTPVSDKVHGLPALEIICPLLPLTLASAANEALLVPTFISSSPPFAASKQIISPLYTIPFIAVVILVK